MAERLGKDLASRGLVIVSGMARGIAAARHHGAMAATGAPSGYSAPESMCVIQKKIKSSMKKCWSGAIISEFPLGTHPAPENFPIRNRIVAGMPLGAVIIEGAEYSGSLITARLAMEFGREVFGVPGNVTQAVSFAPNLLIKQGAKLDQRGRRDRRIAHANPSRFVESRATRSGAAKSPGGGSFERA